MGDNILLAEPSLGLVRSFLSRATTRGTGEGATGQQEIPPPVPRVTPSAKNRAKPFGLDSMFSE